MPIIKCISISAKYMNSHTKQDTFKKSINSLIFIYAFCHQISFDAKLHKTFVFSEVLDFRVRDMCLWTSESILVSHCLAL